MSSSQMNKSIEIDDIVTTNDISIYLFIDIIICKKETLKAYVMSW